MFFPYFMQVYLIIGVLIFIWMTFNRKASQRMKRLGFRFMLMTLFIVTLAWPPLLILAIYNTSRDREVN